MEYERTPDGQIQAATAHRAGKVLLQYESMSKALRYEERFEATLAVALLQMMLTSCQEQLRAIGSRKNVRQKANGLSGLASRSVLDEPALMGLAPECIVECWPSTRGLTYREVFECLRNSLSHPGAQGGTKFPRTGFTSIESGSGDVETYQFTQSSWVNSTGSALSPKFAPIQADEATRQTLERAVREWASNYSVDGLGIELNTSGRWEVVKAGRPFLPVLRLWLGVNQLRTLTLNLSEYLSERLPLRGKVVA